jgi:CubicO group peptidase (beta-lactamase class C family)
MKNDAMFRTDAQKQIRSDSKSLKEGKNNMNTKTEQEKRLTKWVKRILLTFFILVLTIVLIGLGVYVWAWMSTDTSMVARGIMWGDARYDDWKRYPSRAVQASDTPVHFAAEETEIFEDFPIDGHPFEQYLESSNTTAFIVINDDSLLYEGYFNGSNRQATQASLSASKSFVSTLVGIAVEEGFIGSLDDPITTYVPELHLKDPRFEAISIRHLLMMSSGIRFVRDESDPFSDDFITSASPDLRAAALSTEIVGAPGQRFHYNDYNPLLLGIVLERATGMSVSTYLETRLWQPMGAEADGSWDMDSETSGFEKMSVGVNGRTIDLAKLGWLFLHDGKNGDQQVIPAGWIEDTTRPDSGFKDHRGDASVYYQNYWWIDTDNDAYFAEGNFCQFIYVYPSADLVLVRNGKDCGGAYWTGLLGDIAHEIERRING